jgi:RNA polymerase sigma factor (sigma-70 family)
MDEDVFQQLWSSVGYWSRNSQQTEELFAFCCEEYYLKTKDKKIIPETRAHYMSVLFRNSCITYWRKKLKRDKHEILATDMEEEHEELRNITVNTENTMDISMELELFLNSLSETERKFAEHLIEDTPYQEISEEMDIPINTVKTRIHRYRIRWAKHSFSNFLNLES